MFSIGQVVVLKVEKSHGEGEAALGIKSGICGAIVNNTRIEGGSRSYVVDFGPEGQWYCAHEELDGSDDSGFEEEAPQREEERVESEGARITIDEAEEVHEMAGSVFTSPVETTEIPIIINPEADIKRRMKELEKERI